MYFVYLLDFLTNGNITLKSSYDCKEDALSDLETIALNYVRDLEGSKQAMIAFQKDKDIEQISLDTNLKDGLYLKKDNECVIVYQKHKLLLPGKIWNSTELKMTKAALFGITYFKINNQTCVSEIKPTIKKQVLKNTDDKHNNLMNELHKLFSNSDNNFGLKISKKQHSD